MSFASDIATVTFYTAPRYDLLAFGKDALALPFGSISKVILETDSHVWDQAIQIANDIIQLTKATDCTSAKDVECFRLKAQEIFQLHSTNVLKKLLYYLPAQRRYLLTMQEYAFVQLTSLEIQGFQDELDIGRETQQIIPDLGERVHYSLMPTSEWDHSSHVWFHLLRFLSGMCTPLEFSTATEAYSSTIQMLYAFAQYGQTLKLISLDGRRLQKRLRIALGLDDTITSEREIRKHLNELLETSDSIFPISPHDASVLFPNYHFNNEQRAYKVISLTSMVSNEMSLCSKESMELRQCAFCGGYFFVKDQRTKYCSYANRTLKGKTCKEAAAQYILQNKTAMHALREKNYNRYQHWVAQFNDERARKKPSYFLKIRKLILASMKPGEAKQELKDIADEIHNNFIVWRDASSKAVDDYFIGKITEDECKAAVAVPAVPDRSPKLAHWRKG